MCKQLLVDCISVAHQVANAAFTVIQDNISALWRSASGFAYTVKTSFNIVKPNIGIAFFDATGVISLRHTEFKNVWRSV